MADVLMKEWDGKGLECWDIEDVNDMDFRDMGFLDLDLTPSEWPWSDLNLEQDEIQYSSSISELLSTEEELMQIIHNEEPNLKPDNSSLNNCQSLSGSEIVNCDSNNNIEYSETVNGFKYIDSDRLIPCSTDSTEYKGLRLVHLLTACAEAISDGSHDLVEIILCRLKELVSPTGFTMERVAYYLFQSLQQNHHSSAGGDHGHATILRRCTSINESGYISAFSLLNQSFPYIKIAHFTATQSFLEAIPAQTKKVHIIDFDIMEGAQWPIFMEALKNENYRIGQLKITAIKWEEEEEDEEDDDDISDPSSNCCKHTGRRLAEYASSLGIPFSFQESKLEDLRNVKRSDDEEKVMVNCMWELPHMCERSKKDLVRFIHGTCHLNPQILCVGSGPHGIENPAKQNFTERFSQCLNNLCAMFDSSEAGLPEQFGLARAVLERLFLGPTMCRPINSFSENDEGDFLPVMDIPLQCGFAEHDISYKNLMYANYLVTSTNGGRYYTVERVGKHELLLKWNSTSLAFVSTWSTVL